MEQLRKLGISLVLGGIFFLTGCDGSNEIKIDKPKAKQTVDQYISSQGFSGTVLIEQDGVIIMAKGFGYADRENKRENTPDTTFMIGSVTKQFTAVALLMLQEQGILSLDDKLSFYLPTFPSGDKISIRQLLNMTSGIANYTNLSWFDSLKHQSIAPLQLIDRFKNEPLRFEPGTKFEYSNSNYVLAGAIIEKVSGQTYQQFIKDNIFTPLEMHQSEYGLVDNGMFENAVGYGDGKKVTIWDPSIAFAAGALSSTILDLHKWHKALTNHSLINVNSTNELYLASHNGYALGWLVSKGEIGSTSYQHGGAIDGFRAHILRQFNPNRVVIVLSNEEDFPVGEFAHHIKEMTNF
ncbi:D-alanyl-D-alanine carboxypeptidase [Pseudoalteromonas luteoviolacea B = ATCC 29581]|nr:D-alanyl-D-alanine carboxypeptidase [Pseudoalteromonas luteoviolacea B = ATCC 29581]